MRSEDERDYLFQLCLLSPVSAELVACAFELPQSAKRVIMCATGYACLFLYAYILSYLAHSCQA
jgi:CHASE2 domain-containing sensor protein